MTKNVFNATLDVNNKVNRCSFDLSHQNNLTFGLGKIVPVMCERIPPKSSVRIKPSFGLQMMPMAFPVQTRMRAQLSFYKVPIRTLWSDYKDFIGNFKMGLVPPYLDINTEEKLREMCSTSSLGDYLGLPTTIDGNFQNNIVFTYSNKYFGLASSGVSSPSTFYSNINIDKLFTDYFGTASNNSKLSWAVSASTTDPFNGWNGAVAFKGTVSIFGTSYNPDFLDLVRSTFSFGLGSISSGSVYLKHKFSVLDGTLQILSITGFDAGMTIEFSCKFPNVMPISSFTHCFPIFVNTENYAMSNADFGNFTGTTVTLTPVVQAVRHLTLQNSCWYNSLSADKNLQIPLSALPFRAYEAIYNAYYRDNRNNPYILNGQKEYNVWIPNDAGGADNVLYKMRYKNWEPDFLTTAVPSPQQGQAPLVGITTYTSTLSDGTQQLSVGIRDEDGRDLKVNLTGDETGLKDVSYTPMTAAESATVESRSLVSLASSGISIADLRNVNAYQRYLELNMRKGYSYKDVIEGHFDTHVRYSDLMMPEYLGGVTEDVSMNAITQTVENTTDGSYSGSLGSQAGVATVRAQSNNTISTYFDEECYLIGLLSVTPIPNYSQLLPKHWLNRELLDSFYPEFDNIGFQPITYKEVCPLQSWLYDKKSLNDTFGYQRAWYDYVQKVDSVHGEYRTSMRNFLINRVFDVRPQLSESFLLVDPNQVNDVFSVTESTDKIYGQIWFDMQAQLPISRVSIPKID